MSKRVNWKSRAQGLESDLGEARAEIERLTQMVRAMNAIIVPNTLSEEIYRRIDSELRAKPEAAPDRELFYAQLLDYYAEHGALPEFTIEKRS